MADTGAAPQPPTSLTSPASPASPASPPHGALARAERFVRLTPRVLDQHLFAHHFRDGGTAPVVRALDAYRNEDGGYGHGLDPGLRGPASRPPHVAQALRVLDAVGRCDGRSAEDVCRYLTSVSTADGALPAPPPARRGRPDGPAGPAAGDPQGELLVTGPVVGLLHRNEVWHAWLFRATDFCWRAVEALERPHPCEIEAAVAFLDHAPDRARARAAADRLGALLRERRIAPPDPDGPHPYPVAPGHTPGGHHLPHDYARTPRSLARAWFTDEEMARSLDLLAAAQQEDGGWPFHGRRWAPGPALEARSAATLESLRTLVAYGRTVG
ncbi:hypothetical protein [Streptomyces pilosus]|uniref:Prenyltransferase n=1 Tax=Streptomyces pilosus TaxID=28893 RepID=A0A918BM79_9ACTN|nr:hypothetical protein [Streptomyces pilosus]GGQ79444.1 hypothetical protein GCM10010280_27630 [Streptomyces pilosus]